MKKTKRDRATFVEPGDGGRGVERRDFLKIAGFSVGAAALAGCSRGPEHGVRPYVVRPEEITPGKDYWYASVCGACAAGCGILARGRDGRPIKLEGNPDHPLSHGGLCAIGQASVLGLYDSQRLRRPRSEGQEADWADVDRQMRETLGGARRVRFLTDSATGPAERERIATFLARFVDGSHVIYDPVSSSAIAAAHLQTHSARVVPRYRFDRAEVIVGVGADFLGTWISPVEHAAAYAAGRKLDEGGERFSRHVQFESRMSLTGSNADHRVATLPGSAGLILAHIADKLAARRGSRTPWSTLPDALAACGVDEHELDAVVDELAHAPAGHSLVVCGDNDVAAQRLVNYVNHLLGNYGATVDVESPSAQRLGDDGALANLLQEIEAGQVDALFIRGVNPVYDLPDGEALGVALDRVDLVVSLASHDDETAQHAKFVCPEPHYLESWGDAEAVAGLVTLRQPTIRTIGGTRPLVESLAAWSGQAATAYDLVRESWRRNVWSRRTAEATFDTFWNQALQDGFARVRPDGGNRIGRFDRAAVTAPAAPSAAGSDLLLDVHASSGVLDGRHAHNPWLHEVPDPIAKTVWDNFAAIAPSTAAAMGVENGDVVRITGTGATLELPVFVQPGQHGQAVAIGLGYGRRGTERFADVGPQWWEGRPTVEPGKLVGVNAAPLIGWEAGAMSYSGGRVRLEATGARHELVATQIYHSLRVPEHLSAGSNEPRPIVQETSLAAWQSDPTAGAHHQHPLPSLWPVHAMSPHHWGLAIDLTACTGCSACVAGCQAENNIPVVGKDEVRRAREMHWMRIDRYYSDVEADDPDVVHMPMLCQHCDNAPCETVCPVQATVQSAEGLNQQVYNRCVGTRYCANNCPYKVRRFNWFDYAHEDRLQNLALNPDVTVRSRGVMEKCSLCVQRIQDAKAEAKSEGRALADGDIQPACAQSCPTGAIVFGDMNDPESRLSHRKHDPRHFVVLGELGVKPVVGYMTLVRNREGGEGDAHS